MHHYAALVAGIVCAGIGGDLFVRGAVGLARWGRISPGIIGATVAAFVTSSPELSVSISSAIVGKPQIALGDALGSNVVNISLILGAALSISAIQSSHDSLKRDFPVALLVPIITGLLCVDGEISRLDGILMLCAFLIWLLATIVEARKQRSAAAQVFEAQQPWIAIAYCAIGLVLLIAAGYFIVSGAKGVASRYGIAEFIIGATVVAVGTSIPELATAIVAKLRGHDEVGLGTLLGSNIFNGLFIMPLAATIHPIAIDWREVLGALAFGIVALLCSYPSRTGFIKRRRGFLLLSIYAVYLTAILQTA